jgi:hypothetical protein
VWAGATTSIPGAGFRDRTHVQIAIRNHDMILGYFRVEGMT